MVWNGLVLVPAVLVYWPVRIGTFWPTLMVASSLSRVIRFGVDRIFALPSDSSACATAPRPSAPLICLKMPRVSPPRGAGSCPHPWRWRRCCVGAAGERLQRPHAVVAGAVAGQAQPLHAEFGCLGRRHFDDQRLDVDLGAAHVELVDHGAQVAVHGFVAGQNQRIRRRIGLDETGRAAGRQLLRRVVQRSAAGAAALRIAAQASAVHAAVVLADLVIRVLVADTLLRRGGRAVRRHYRAQGLRQLGGVRILRLHHVHIAQLRGGLVQLRDQRLGQVGARRRRRAQRPATSAKGGGLFLPLGA